MGRKKDRSRFHQRPQPAKLRPRPVTPHLSRLDAIIERHALSIFLVAIVAVKLVVFRDFVLLRNAYLYKDIGSDSINSTYPTLFHIVDYLRTEGIPKWSFFEGMGQNLVGPLVFDPFLSVFYLVGPDRVAYAIGYVELAKEILGGLFFFLFLRQKQVGGHTAIVGGLLYAFTGYVVLGGGWYMFSYDAMCIAGLLYAYEKWHTEHTWYLLPIPIALMAAYQPFFLYLYALVLISYATIRTVDDKEWSPAGAAKSLLTLGAAGSLGVALSAVFFLGNVSQIINSPRVGGNASFFHILSSQPLFQRASVQQYVSEVLRLFSSDLMGTGNSFRGWGNYLEAPLLYAGLITLLLVPQCLVLIDRRRKVTYIALFVACMVPLVFPYFRYAFWLFAGDYFRTLSFLVAVVLVYLGVRGLDLISRGGRVSVPTLLFSLLGALVVLYLPSPVYDQHTTIDEGLRSVIAVFLVIHAALILALRAPRHVVMARMGILIAIGLEAGYFANITVNERSVLSSAELSQRIGYNDHTREAIHFLDSLDVSFFRVSKDYASSPAMHASINDGMVQRYRGTSSYNPFNQKGYIDFLQAFDVIHPGNEIETRWAPGTLNRLALQGITSVKYGLTKRSEQDAFGPTYEHLADFNDVHVYRNRYALPLGFCYDTYVARSALAGLSPDLKDELVVRAVIVDEQDARLFGGFPTIQRGGLVRPYTIADYDADIRARRADTLSVREHTQNRIGGTITLAHERLLFLAIPFDRGWSARVDGKDAKLLEVNVGFMGLILEPGTHSVVLEFEPPYLLAGAGVSFVAVLAYALLLYRSKVSRAPKVEP